MRKVKIGLALGSGGLRGLAHIGVLKVLQQEKIPVHYIAGCSIGSLIGALYASGMDVGMMEKLALNVKRRHVLDFVVPKNGILAGERIQQFIRLLTRNARFEDLQIPLAVVATHLGKGSEVVFHNGYVAPAVRASISVPGVFVPMTIEGNDYIDGAVVNPTPADVVRQMGAELVISVDLLGNEPSVCKINNMFDVMVQAIDIMERELNKHRLQQADVNISPAVNQISPSSFHNLEALISLGEQAARSALPDIQARINDPMMKQA